MNVLRPILAIIAAALLFAVYQWDVDRVERGVLQQLQEQRLLFFRPENVTKLVFSNEAGGLTMERSPAGEWKITEPTVYTANKSLISSFLENLRGAKRHQVFKSDSLEEYGLKAPRRQFTIHYTEDGAEQVRTVLFGDQPSEAGRLYAKVDDEDVVFTLSDWIFRQMGATWKDFRDQSLLSESISNATRLSIRTPRQDFSINRDSISSKWRLTGSGKVPVPADNILVDRVFSTLSQGMFLEIIDDPTSTTTQMGFDKPIATVRIDGETVLTVGNRLPEKEQILVRNDAGIIGVVTGTTVADLFRPATEWGTKRFVWFSQDSITQVETSSGNSSLMVIKEDSEWTDPTNPDMVIRKDSMDEFLTNLLSFSAMKLERNDLPKDAEIEYGIVPQGYTVRVTSKEGTEQGFRFGQTDTREGFSYVLRLQDRSLWRVDFRLQNTVFRFRNDLEELRLVPSLITDTAKIEIEVKGVVMSFEKTPTAWRANLPDEKPTLIPVSVINPFLQSFQELEYDGELLSRSPFSPQATFRLYRAGEKESYSTVELLNRSAATRRALFRVNGRQFEVQPEPFDVFDEAMTNLLLGAKLVAEKERGL